MFSNLSRPVRAAMIAGVSASVVLGTAALGTAVAAAGTRPAAAAATVPWGSVGSGWVLDMYSKATPAKPAPATLYLVSPAGAKYALHRWQASATQPELISWAGDKTEALLRLVSAHSGPLPAWEELNLRTGKTTPVKFGGATPIGFTLPAGQQILAATISGGTATIARYSQAGVRMKNLATENVRYLDGFDTLPAVYSADGKEIAVGAANGILLVSNAGGVLRRLPVAGADGRLGCYPQRWWAKNTVLVSCTPRSSAAPQLWLVPVSGARPSPLTPVRRSGSDYGDVDAWKLSSGLYLQSLGACGTLEINKQAKNGSVTRVNVPGASDSPIVVTANRSQLLVWQSSCDGSAGQLLWFNPATRAEKWLFKTGSVQVLPYNSTENGSIRF